MSEQKRVNWVVVRPCGCLCYAASIGQGPEDQDLRNEVAQFLRKGEDVRRMTTEEVRASPWQCDVCKPPEKTYPLFGG